MAKPKSRLTVEGVVIDDKRKAGPPGLVVEAWDVDDSIDRPVGTATTDDGGRFRIECDTALIRRHYPRKQPRLYFKVFCDIDLLTNTSHKVVYNPARKTGPRIVVPGLSRWCPPRKHRCEYRDIYLKIEEIKAYSPVEPNPDAHGMYRRDCFRNTGHADGKIPDSEVDLRKLDALVYRQYTDASYTTPVTDKLIDADILEPPYYTRVPGAVIYTKPGERLRIHVKNCHRVAHSFHVHGLAYGIDSDGAYPFGVRSHDGRRSDEICPGDTWCYEFEVREDMVGCWPFHSHYRKTQHDTDRGLFGGIVVRDPRKPTPDHEVPFFMHRMKGERETSVFDSGTLLPGDTFTYSFPNEGAFPYNCRFHNMPATVEVESGGPAAADVAILDADPRFEPAVVKVGPGGLVTWTHAGTQPHTVTESAGNGSAESFSINGRAFEGNTPRIVARSGERIRWYVFNLDLGMMWHNFHTHAQRWKWGDAYVDTRSLGPAESFCVDTIVPDVILQPCRLPKRGEKKIRCELCADFPVHCHVEPHMMQGMAATVRAVQSVSLTSGQLESLGFELPAPCSHHGCPEVDVNRCRKSGTGRWEALPDCEVFVVHAAVLHTGKVLLFSGRAEQYSLPADYPLESRLLDPTTLAQTTQTVGENLFCAGQTFMADGKLIVGGGDRPVAGQPRIDSTHVFDPVGETWTKLSSKDMNDPRWYPTLFPLSDGRIYAASGTGGVWTSEIYGPSPGDPSIEEWTLVSGANKDFGGLYPSLHLLPNGEVFWSRTSWQYQSGTSAARLTLPEGTYAGAWNDQATMEFPDRQEGASVLLIDATVTPPLAHIYVVGGGAGGVKNPQSVEMIDVTTTTPAPSWVRAADLNFPRTNVNALVLPDGRILAVGGQRNGKWASDPQPVYEAEIYDPATDTWAVTPPMASPRQYHSIAVLLPDARVLTAGGIDPTLGGTPQRDQRSMELFYPPYLDAGPRPAIAGAPAGVAYGSSFLVATVDAPEIAMVSLIRPHAVTHHTDAGHRFVKLAFTVSDVGELTVEAPANACVAPPGYYMLFIVNNAGIPSEAAWVQVA